MHTRNRATILGHVGNEVILRHTANGKPVVNLSLATSHRRKDGPEVTTWHRVVLWDKKAELAERYVTRGAPVYVEGPLTNREWVDKEGVTRKSMEMTAYELILLGKGGGANSAPRTGKQSQNGEELAEVKENIPF